MKRERFGELDVWMAGGEDREGGGDGPAIVLCHGFGAPGDDLASLWRGIDAGRGVRWFFPEAPLDLSRFFGQPARAWWEIDMAKLDEAIRTGRRDELTKTVPEGMAEARAALEQTLAELEEKRNVEPSRTLLGGFSQGAMITTEIALHAGASAFAGLAILSGTLLCEDRWRAAAEVSGSTIHAIQTHGRRDPLLPFDLAERLRTMLEEAGARIEFVPHGGAHEIPGSALDALGRLARSRLASAGGTD